jgi:hypothetical protein
MNLSASSIATFKACPFRFYYQYILGLVPVLDTDTLRMGTNYHRIQQIASMTPGGTCECRVKHPELLEQHCVLCEGTGIFPNDPMDAVIRELNQTYSERPLSKTPEEWEVERIILLYSLIGYQWYYSAADNAGEGYKIDSLEQKFELPLLSPVSGRKLQANLRGKIDRIFSAGENRFVHEYKSTSKAIDPDSTYWNHLTLDTQTRLYTYAARQLGLGLCGVLYDVWHKPQISPKKLTQAESKKFVADGEYMGEKFVLKTWPSDAGNQISVNNIMLEIEPGAKEGTFAIRETPEMFGARLLQDITTLPEYYFARKEITHHEEDIKAFEWELFNIYTSIRMMNNKDVWWRNEAACEATYRCSYIDWCYNNLDIKPGDVPENFKCTLCKETK